MILTSDCHETHDHILLFDGSYKSYIQIQFVPHKKHFLSATKPNRLMLFRETVAVYCENHTEHTDTLCVWTECGVR
jgi:hypothetical protein